jgi:molybdate transport repressor ModE-like protein
MPLSPRMPDLASLELLLAVASRGSLSAAGRDLGLSQQAASARLVSLEAQTGVRLVTRSTRGSSLTASGAVAAQWADRLLQVAHEVDAGLASLRETTRSRVKVSASLTIAEQLLPGWLVSLQAAARRRGETPVEVVLTATNSHQVLDLVRSGDAELGFIEAPGVPRGLRSRVVAHDELVLVVLPRHRWARRGSPVTAGELCRTPLVTREPGSGTRDYLTAALRNLLGPGAAEAPPALELATSASVRAAVLAGSAPAVLSRLAVSDDIATGRLRVVPVDGLDLRRDLRAVWAGGRTPPAGALRDLLAHIGTVTRRRRPSPPPRPGTEAEGSSPAAIVHIAAV